MSNRLNEPDGATPLELDEIEGLRFAHITTIGELDQLEQANIVEGMQWLKKQRNADILSEGFVGSVASLGDF
jgi:fido (protein-threonine AMPylation protein)